MFYITSAEIVDNTGRGLLISNGVLQMINSLVAFNDAPGENGGGLYLAEGDGNNHIHNSTFAENTAARGAGIYYEMLSGSGYLENNRVTLAYNNASIGGGGAYLHSTSARFKVIQGIVANNTAPSGPDLWGYVEAPNTLVGNWSGNTASIPGDPSFPCICVSPPQTLDARIGELTNLGGPTEVIPLMAGSYALDRVERSGSAWYEYTDQRGYASPVLIMPWRAPFIEDVGAVEMRPNEIEGLFQAEDLTVASSSGDSHSTLSNSALSAGKAASFQGNATNDYVTYRITVPQAGTYEIRSAHRLYNNRGIYRLYQSSSASSQGSAVGGSVDLYSGTTDHNQMIHGTVTLPAGTRYLRFRCMGKNASSSGYRMMLDYIELIRQ
jgi:hypothetical protein